MITWHAAYTQPDAEARAAEHLERQGYLAYLPRYRRHVRHARRESLVLRPLFPRYLLVGIDRLVQRWRPVRSTVGMVGLVASAEEPVPVAAAIVDALRAQESDGAFDIVAPTQRLRAGDDIRVTHGPFGDLMGGSSASPITSECLFCSICLAAACAPRYRHWRWNPPEPKGGAGAAWSRRNHRGPPASPGLR